MMRGASLPSLFLGLVAAGCGGRVEVEPDAQPDAQPEPDPATWATDDPCAVYEDRSACCAQGCRVFRPDASTFRCIGASFDCARHDGICTSSEICVHHSTSGDGGCDLNYGSDTVGACMEAEG